MFWQKNRLKKDSQEIFLAIGLMSGTSMDGIDLALIESDGKKVIRMLDSASLSYPQNYQDFHQKLKNVVFNTAPQLIKMLGDDFENSQENDFRSVLMKKNSNLFAEIIELESESTKLHAKLVLDFLKNRQINPQNIDLIGFHGQTIFHQPAKKITWQIGNGQLLADCCGIKVVNDFRSSDVLNGGQGAPLVPIFHFNLFQSHKNLPIVILNIGGVSNATYVPNDDENSLIAWDVCYGNAPLDDLIRKNSDNRLNFDEDGKIALSGKPDIHLAEELIGQKIFQKQIPRSFDRQNFAEIYQEVTAKIPEVNNALATLIHIFCRILVRDLKNIGNLPGEILLCGGGAKNFAIFQSIKSNIEKDFPHKNIQVEKIEKYQFDGSFLEAQAFAYLGIRSHLKLPLTFPKTTGVKINFGNSGNSGCCGGITSFPKLK